MICGGPESGPPFWTGLPPDQQSSALEFVEDRARKGESSFVVGDEAIRYNKGLSSDFLTELARSEPEESIRKKAHRTLDELKSPG